MELCTIEDAFPNIGGPTKSDVPFTGGKDGYSSREERRAARKLAKKNKVAAAYIEKADIPDPDRLVQRLEQVDTVQKEKEAFALPVLPKASCLFSDTGTPNYFGKWAEDEDENENFSSFNPSPKDDSNYRLYPDFTKGDLLKGVAKAAGTLPEPPLNDQWKPMTEAASYTAYYSESAPASKLVKPIQEKPEWFPEETGPVGVNDRVKGNTHDDLLKRIDELMGRLDQMEKKQAKDSQTEILMFVGTGLFILVSFELMTRR